MVRINFVFIHLIMNYMETPARKTPETKYFRQSLKTHLRNGTQRIHSGKAPLLPIIPFFQFPDLFVVIIAVAGLFFGREVVNNHIVNQITSSMGEETAGQIQSIVASQTEERKSIWAAIIGVVTMLIRSYWRFRSVSEIAEYNMGG